VTVELRPGKKQHVDPGPDWGVRVIEPGPQAAAGGGWWDDFGAIGCCVGAWAGRGAANYAASLLDLSGNGNNLTEIGGGPPAWNAVQGWFNFVALNRCLDTGIIPASGWSLLIQYANAPVNNSFNIGQKDHGNTWFAISPNRAAGVVYCSGGIVTVAPGLATGNLGIAGQQGYRNGAADGAPTPAWAGPTTQSVYIGAFNNNGAAASWSAADIWAASLYNCILTAPQMLAVATGMAAL
jgi:hypothetical protein